MLIIDCYMTGVWKRGEVEMRWREKERRVFSESDRRERQSEEKERNK